MDRTAKDVSSITSFRLFKTPLEELLVKLAIVIPQVGHNNLLKVFGLQKSTFLTSGSRNLQCSPEGQCECKPGVTGPKCDQCEANYWNFGSLGCQSCGCYPDGSANNNPNCDTLSGDCYCKQNVEGKAKRNLSTKRNYFMNIFISLQDKDVIGVKQVIFT